LYSFVLFFFAFFAGKKLTSCDMRPLRIVRPPRPGGAGVLAPALVTSETHN